MKPKSHSFEANLLYQIPFTNSPASLAKDIRAVAQVNDITLETMRQTDEGFVLFTCDTLQILIASVPAPLPAEHFLQANRPRAASLDEAAMLARLTGMKAHITILVADRKLDAPNDSAQFQKKRALCWGLADCLLARTHPDMIFWCETDTLYAAEEFERACAYLSSQGRTIGADGTASHIPEMFLLEPILPEKVQRWMEGQSRPLRPATAYPTAFAPLSVPLTPRAPKGYAVAALDTLVSFALPTSTLIHFDRLQASWDGKRAKRGLAMACSAATIGMCAQTGLPGFL